VLPAVRCFKQLCNSYKNEYRLLCMFYLLVQAVILHSFLTSSCFGIWLYEAKLASNLDCFHRLCDWYSLSLAVLRSSLLCYWLSLTG